MKTYFFNGEGWYCNDRSLFQRIRTWLIWVGGWELANGKGWRLFLDMPGGKKHLMSPCPVSIFGHWCTFYGWGLNIKLNRGWFVWVFRGYDEGRIYLSDDATPGGAYHWIKGTPQNILNAVEERQRFHDRKYGTKST